MKMIEQMDELSFLLKTFGTSLFSEAQHFDNLCALGCNTLELSRN